MEHAKPYPDIAARIRWHRGLMSMTQSDYADAISVKRTRLAVWETGTQRLSLDGALALRRKWGLSLDFLYLGDAGALPMTLCNAWLDDRHNE